VVKKETYLLLGSACLLLSSALLFKKIIEEKEIKEPVEVKKTEAIIKPSKFNLLYFHKHYNKIAKWLPYVKEAARKYGLDPAILAAIIYQESKGNPNAISETGAIGLMQIMPDTALKVCGYTSDLLFNPYYNIDCGAKYLAELYKKTGNYAYAVAKYYGGPKATPYSRFGSPPVYKYVSEVMNHFKKLRELV